MIALAEWGAPAVSVPAADLAGYDDRMTRSMFPSFGVPRRAVSAPSLPPRLGGAGCRLLGGIDVGHAASPGGSAAGRNRRRAAVRGNPEVISFMRVLHRLGAVA